MNKYLWADEPCDRFLDGHESVYAAWRRLFGETLDLKDAVETIDNGDHTIYRMANGHTVVIACDGNTIE